jgi:predicted kinase
MYLIRGLPGSGKSCLAENLLAEELRLEQGGEDVEPTDRVIEADQFFTKDGVYAFDPERLKEAHADCLKRAIQLMAGGKALAVSNTFSQGWEMEPYLHEAERYDYEVVVLHCQNDFGSVHGVPPEAIQRMRDRWEHTPECLVKLHQRQRAQGEETRQAWLETQAAWTASKLAWEEEQRTIQAPAPRVPGCGAVRAATAENQPDYGSRRADTAPGPF